MMWKVKTTIAALALSSLAPFAMAAELLMAERAGCHYCARWLSDIGPAYPKTPEGAFAPLRRYDLDHDEAEADLARRVVYTPTFILIEDGRELARIEGYPGPDFFWPLLDQMLRQHTDYAASGG